MLVTRPLDINVPIFVLLTMWRAGVPNYDGKWEIPAGCKWVDSYVVVTSLCWIWSMACLGGAEDTTVFLNTMGDGLWGTAANWSLDSVLTATSHAVINNGRVVFSRLVELGE